MCSRLLSLLKLLKRGAEADIYLTTWNGMKSILKIRKIVGILHKNGIMHGDLTTSNFILTKERLIIMDFGLAQKTEKVEDHAIDLRLFKEVLNSAHVDIVGKSWQSFLHGYKKIVGGTRMERVIAQVSVIEKRGRYANVV